MITVYSPYVSNRLVYVLDFIFSDLLEVKYILTDNSENLDGIVINYSEEALKTKNYQIIPNNLIKGTDFDQPEGRLLGDSFLIFSNANDDHGFDIFSAVFYLISRMEEYHLIKVDQHSRFISSQSILFKHKVNHLPIVDIWAYDLLFKLNQIFSSSLSSKKSFNQYCTFDIDNAYAFKHKGTIRTLASFGKDVVNFRKNKIVQRSKLLAGKSSDPYDTYDYILEFCKKHKISHLFFFLLGDYGKNDKNISYDNSALHKLINYLFSDSNIGIHPSYNSFLNPDQIKKEVLRLKNILGSSIDKSRFHFLRFKYPDSCKNLISNEIYNDYSMGYSDLAGFRAGTCTPFYFYDLGKELRTNLKIHPFVYMDGALNDRENISIDDAIFKIKNLKKQVQKVNGQFTAIWHNESLSDLDRWKGWRRVFESTWI